MLLTGIRPMVAGDWPAVAAIYADGIADGDATFESSVPAWHEFDEHRLAAPRLVAVSDAGDVRGWAAATPVSARAVYRGVVEHSIYIDRAARGRGVGATLLRAFVAAAEDAGIWTIQASVFPENTVSLRLHDSVGFRRVGVRERIARADAGPRAGQWRDTVLIERRSPRNGRE
ncbi:GNAT family N-acetyltransferase [Microbacterium aureliae]